MTFELELLKQRDVKNFIHYNVAITQGLTQATVTVNQDNTNYMILAMPSWSTTLFVTNKTAASFKANFGTAAPVSAFLDWLIISS